MHEMSIAHSILTEVERLVEKHRAQKALWVKINVGVLSGVVNEQLVMAFDIYKKQFEKCHDLELRLTTVNLKLKCKECLAITEQDEMHLQCKECHSFLVDILDGKDMVIEKLELDIP